MWLGFEIGQTFSYMVYFEAPNVIFFWIIIGVGMFTVAAIAAMNFNYHMIWVTAMIGAFVFL